MPLFGEIFLSDIQNKPVLDPKGEVLGKAVDLIIIKGDRLPKISGLILSRKKIRFRLGWADINMFNKKIISANLYAGSLASLQYQDSEDDLLASRDILDKQIVDVDGVKVVRANDIKFEGYGPEALLVAIDVGMRGILRRMGVERLGEDAVRLFRGTLPNHLISWNYMQPLQPKLSEITLTIQRQMVSDLHPADLADLISQVSPDEGAKFIENLDVETAAETISELDPQAQTAVISDMDPSKAADIIEEMPPDEAADLIGELSDEKAQEILGKIEKEEAEDIQELLGHESDTAGGIMTNAFISYLPSMNIGELIERFKKDSAEMESIYYVYAVDEEERLCGVSSLKEILLAGLDEKFSDIMNTNIKSVRPEADEMEVARVISKYNLVALPVVDCDSCMVGLITVDDILSRILPGQPRRKRRGV